MVGWRRPSHRWKMIFDGGLPLVEDDLRRKTTFCGRWTLVEDDLRWKTIFGGRQPLVEDDLWWKTTFDGRWPLVEDDLQRKTTFCERRPLMEDNLQWKTPFGGRRPLVEDDLVPLPWGKSPPIKSFVPQIKSNFFDGLRMHWVLTNSKYSANFWPNSHFSLIWDPSKFSRNSFIGPFTFMPHIITKFTKWMIRRFFRWKLGYRTKIIFLQLWPWGEHN